MSVQDVPQTTKTAMKAVAKFIYVVTTAITALTLLTIYEPVNYAAQSLATCPQDLSSFNVAPQNHAMFMQACLAYRELQVSLYTICLIGMILTLYIAVLCMTNRKDMFARTGDRHFKLCNHTELCYWAAFVLFGLIVTVSTYRIFEV